MKNQIWVKRLTLLSAMGLVLTGCGKTESTTANQAASTAATESSQTETEKPTETETETETEKPTESETETEATTENTQDIETTVIDGIETPKGYTLYWHDEFDNDGKLPEEDWNYEAHEVGWVNHELQEYIPSEEYAYVKDGELVIQPVKNVDDNGNVSYVSGRVNTQGKHDIKYGYIEARIKVPQGQGFLPAFWMMPLDEQYYGQWPKCGEIDIMEVLGNSINTNYGTVHYGEPHKQNQGSIILKEGDFANEYHTYALEWYPNLMRWYVDGKLYFETNEWFTAVEGEEEKPYPAPFNQQFHVILNVAVGGDWPGSPDDSTVFDDRAAMKVDYVRMFRKKNYNENVKRPEREMVFKEADATGNFITNGDFAEVEDLSGSANWTFLELNGGVGSAEIKDGEIIISTSDAGSEEYSIQLVQPNMPMMNGKKYKYSFEAKADENRKMKAAVTAPTVDWIRYFPDTSVDLTPDWQTYEFTFDMTEKDDDRGRVEFNMGNQGSSATIHIKNVRLEVVE